MVLVTGSAQVPAKLDACNGFISRLIARCAHGDKDALLALLDRFYPLAVAATSRNVEPRNVDRSIEEAFAALWHDSHNFRPSRVSAVDFVMSHVVAASNLSRG